MTKKIQNSGLGVKDWMLFPDSHMVSQDVWSTSPQSVTPKA